MDRTCSCFYYDTSRAAGLVGTEEGLVLLLGNADVELLRLLDEPVIGLDRESRYVFVNPAALKLKGLPETDLMGRGIWEVFPEGLGSILHTHCAAAEVARTHVQFEGFYVPFSAWFEVHIYPGEDALWVLFRDITLRKNAELAVTDSEKRFRTLFEDVPVALYRTSASGELLDVNPALVRMLKYPDLETFMSVNAADVYFDPSERKAWQDLLSSGNDIATFEMRDRCFDGSVIWVRDTATAIRDAAGQVLYYQGTLEDITERRKAEEALRESEARFRLLATASQEVIWDWDLVSGEVRWNEAIKAVFGFSPEDIGPGIEHSYAWWISHIHEDDRVRIALELHAAVQGNASEWSGQYRFRRLDGTYARVHDRGYIGRDEGGRATRIIGSITDLDKPPHWNRVKRPVSQQTLLAPPVPVASDATLVDWISRGDERAFDALYGRHATFVYSVAHALLKEAAETDEVVADTFLNVWRTASNYDGARGTVSAWIANIARARALERLRKSDRRARLSEGQTAPETVHDSEPGIPAETEAMLERSLSQLPEAQRRVIEMAYFKGLTHAEIAHHLGEPLGTVKTRLRAGIEKLRRGLTAPE